MFVWASQCFAKCCLRVSCLPSILGVFSNNSTLLGMWSNLSIHTLCNTPYQFNCSYPTKGSHLFCLKSIGCFDFLFGKKKFEPFFPSMVLIMYFSFKKFLLNLAHHVTILPPPQFILPYPLLDKRNQTIASNLTSHPWPYI